MEPHIHVEPRVILLLQRLSVVAALRPHEKLCVHASGDLTVQAPCATTSALRYCSGQARNGAIDAIAQGVTEIGGLLHTLAELHQRGQEGLAQLLTRWTQEMYTSWTGLETLKQTYQGDSATVSRLVSVQHALDRVVDQIEAAVGKKVCTRVDKTPEPTAR
jgi:hypothetical protein